MSNTAYTNYGTTYGTPLVGSAQAWCGNCGARGTVNRALLKKGQHKIPTCIICRGNPQAVPQPDETRPKRRYRATTPPEPPDDPTGTPTCMAPLTRGPNQGRPATGTTTGYMRHYRAKEPPCPACRYAAALQNYERNQP